MHSLCVLFVLPPTIKHHQKPLKILTSLTQSCPEIARKAAKITKQSNKTTGWSEDECLKWHFTSLNDKVHCGPSLSASFNLSSVPLNSLEFSSLWQCRYGIQREPELWLSAECLCVRNEKVLMWKVLSLIKNQLWPCPPPHRSRWQAELWHKIVQIAAGVMNNSAYIRRHGDINFL